MMRRPAESFLPAGRFPLWGNLVSPGNKCYYSR
nr:MAG TPA: hypothetical protein [Caudoviricetes sp.]